MDVFAIASWRETSIAIEEIEELGRKLERLLPFGRLSVQRESWRSFDGQTALLCWSASLCSSAKSTRRLIHQDGARALAVSGYWYSSDCPTLKELYGEFLRTPNPDELVSRLGGEHIPIFCNGEVVRLWKGLSTIPPLFVGYKPDSTVVSNRASIVYALLNSDAEPQYDSEALAAFVTGQVYSTRSTVFSGVHVVDVNEKITISAGAMETSKIDDGHLVYCSGHTRLDEECLDELCHNFISSIRAVDSVSEQLRIQLSGGKDSRIIASSMVAAGVEPKARIYGWRNDKDIKIANEIAARFRWDVEDATGDITSQRFFKVDWKKGLAESLFLMDGLKYFKPSSLMHTPYSRVEQRFPPGISVLGSAAEILRGGNAVLTRQWDWDHLIKLTTTEAENKIRGQLPSTNGLIREEFIRPMQDWVNEWIETYRSENVPIELLEKSYLFFTYLFNWNVAAWMSAPEGGEIHPALDNRVIRSISKLERDCRLFERIHTGLIKRMCPVLLDIPFPTGEQWASEAWGTSIQSDNPKVYQPIFTLAGVAFRKEFASALLDLPSHHRIFDIVKRKELHELLRGEALFEPAKATQLWNVLALQTLVDNEWLSRETLETDLVTVDLLTPWPDFYRDLCLTVKELEDTISISSSLVLPPHKSVQDYLSAIGEVYHEPISVGRDAFTNSNDLWLATIDPHPLHFEMSVAPANAVEIEKADGDYITLEALSIKDKGMWVLFSIPAILLASQTIRFSLEAKTTEPYSGVAYICREAGTKEQEYLARSSCKITKKFQKISISSHISDVDEGMISFMIPLGQKPSSTKFEQVKLERLLFENRGTIDPYSADVVTEAVCFRLFNMEVASILADQVQSLAQAYEIDLSDVQQKLRTRSDTGVAALNPLTKTTPAEIERIILACWDRDEFDQFSIRRNVIEAFLQGILYLQGEAKG